MISIMSLWSPLWRIFCFSTWKSPVLRIKAESRCGNRANHQESTPDGVRILRLPQEAVINAGRQVAGTKGKRPDLVTCGKWEGILQEWTRHHVDLPRHKISSRCRRVRLSRGGCSEVDNPRRSYLRFVIDTWESELCGLQSALLCDSVIDCCSP